MRIRFIHDDDDTFPFRNTRPPTTTEPSGAVRTIESYVYRITMATFLLGSGGWNGSRIRELVWNPIRSRTSLPEAEEGTVLQ